MPFALTTDVYADLVKETTTTAGIGTITLAGADISNGPAQSFQAAIGVGSTCDYRLASGNGTDWEIGNGTIGGSGPYTLARNTVYASSNSGAKISLTGTSKVALVVPAAKTPFPFQNKGVWSGSIAYAAHNVVLFNGDVYVSNVPIPAPTGSVTVSSPTASQVNSGSSTWNATYSTTGPNRLIIAVLDVPDQSVTAGTFTGVASPNVTWSNITDTVGNGIGFTNYMAVWAGLAGPQLTNEPITISLGSSVTGDILLFDIEGLNLAGTVFDPNAALPDAQHGNGPTSISSSFTTSNANDMLLFLAGAGNTDISSTPPTGFTFIGASGHSGNDGVAAFYKSVAATQSGVGVATPGSAYQAWVGVATAVETPATPTNLDPTADTRWQRITSISTMFDELFGSSAGTVAARSASQWVGLGPLTNGEILIGSTGAVPVAAPITAGSGISVTTGAGSITISATGSAANTGLWATSISAIPTSASTGFTSWVNQGGASVADRQNGVSITAPASSGDSVRVRYQTAPSTPYKVKALVGLSCLPNNYQAAGIGWMAGSPPTTSTALWNVGIQYNTGLNNWTLSVDEWTNVTTHVGGGGTPFNGPLPGHPLWLQLSNDGTNYTFGWSISGDDNDFVPLLTGTLSGSFLGSGNFNNIIFFTNRNNNGGSTSAIGTLFDYGT